MLRPTVAWVAVVVLASGVAAAMVSAHDTHSASGPLASMTGAPAIGGADPEADCTLCHQDYDNPCLPEPCNLNTPGGGVAILDLPADYLPGQPIPLRVRLWTDSTLASATRKWGFQITAVRELNGAGSGTWQAAEPDTLLIEQGAAPYDTRSYLMQKTAGTRTGLGGPVEWSFTWNPPAGNDGRVIFCVAGNATNGNDEPGPGDFVFTARETLPPSAVPVRPVSWGALKQRFR